MPEPTAQRLTRKTFWKLSRKLINNARRSGLPQKAWSGLPVYISPSSKPTHTRKRYFLARLSGDQGFTFHAGPSGGQGFTFHWPSHRLGAPGSHICWVSEGAKVFSFHELSGGGDRGHGGYSVTITASQESRQPGKSQDHTGLVSDCRESILTEG